MLSFLMKKKTGENTGKQPWRISEFGRLYLDNGKTLGQAVEDQKHRIAEKKKGFGENHSETLKEICNLAVLYCDQGKPEKAEIIYKKVIAEREKAQGAKHPQTLKWIKDLGTVYSSMGRLEDAQRQYEKALAAQEELLGPESPETINTVAHLGVMYANQEKLEQARKFLERAVAESEKHYGPSNHKTLQLLTDLAGVCTQDQKYNEAEAMYDRALIGLEKELGPDDRETLWAVSHLANVYNFQGRIAEANKFYERAWLGFRKILGPNHPNTLSMSGYFTKTLAAKGEGLEYRPTKDRPSGDPLPSASKHQQSDDTEVFSKNILIADRTWQYQSATALLDTQCQLGNWISKRLVDRLHRSDDIQAEVRSPEVQDVNGQEVMSHGTIKLSWKWNLRSRVFDAKFHVFQNSNNFDVSFGVEYIVAEGMISFNSNVTDVIAPLVANDKLKAYKKAEKAAIALAKEQQRQEKAALEARKAEQARGQQQGQSSQQEGSQQAQQQQNSNQ